MFLEILLGKLAGNLAWAPLKPLPGCTCLKTCSGNLVLLGKNMFLEILLGKLAGNLAWTPLKPFCGCTCLKTCSGNLVLLGKNHVPGNLAWETVAGNLENGS